MCAHGPCSLNERIPPLPGSRRPLATLTIPPRTGDEMSLLRDFFDQFQTLVLFRYVSGALTNLTTNAAWSYNPPMTSISDGDLNGDGDDEVVMLRDPGSDPGATTRTSLLAINPLGAAMRNFQVGGIGNNTTAWRLVRTGDVDGDGRVRL